MGSRMGYVPRAMGDKPQNISYLPTSGLSYDPSEALYWNEEALDMEVERVFEVCHGCRMCFKYCDAFPNLFDLIDNKYDGDVTQLTRVEKDGVMDDCFQCKLCEVQCPYTPRDKHEFQLDFPKLVHRYQAQRAKHHGPSLRDLALRDPDRTATMARASFGLANTMNRVGVHRWFMEKVIGIHRDKQLPDFAGETFDRWATQTGRASEPPGGEVVLFQTCYVQHNEPQIGKDTVDVMEKNGVDMRCVEGLVCCGMPRWESGDLEGFRKQAKRNLDVLEPLAKGGAKILGLNPTCSMMLRREYPDLVAPEDKERAQLVADAVREASEFLWSIRKEERFNTDTLSSPGDKVAYHAPCHLRAQRVGFKGRDLIKKVTGAKPSTVMECCGHDGTYAMKVEGFVPAAKVGKRSFDEMNEGEAEIWATDCPLASLQFEQHAGVRPMHPMSILARAYRKDGFSKAIAKTEAGTQAKTRDKD